MDQYRESEEERKRRLRESIMNDTPEVASPPVDDPWKATARRLGEEATAAAAAKAEVLAEHSRRQAAAREQAEQKAESGRARINEFLARMRAAGNPGCRDHHLSMKPSPYEEWKGYNATTMRADGPYGLVVRGWEVDGTATRYENVSSWHDPPSHTTYERTILSVDGIAYYAKSQSGPEIYERHLVKPEDITLEMLVRTLTKNGVEV